MLEIAIVEDSPMDRQALVQGLERFEKEEKESFHITEFPDALDFLEQRKLDFPIVFMDIQMPYMDGLAAARRFRERNTQSVLIFITNMTEYAVQGYEVDALDYIVKPLNYYSFALKMKRAVKQVHLLESQSHLINSKDGLAKIALADVRYIEVLGHKVVYHLDGRDIEAYGSMKKVLAEIPGPGFALCNNCYYVNLRYVTAVEGFLLRLGDTELQISHPKKKSFLKALNEYVGGSSL